MITVELNSVTIYMQDKEFPVRVVLVQDRRRIGADWVTEPHRYHLAKMAPYFYKKHIEGVNDEKLLKKAEKKILPPAVESKKAFAIWLEAHMMDVVGVWGYDTPLDNYIRDMKDQDKWKKGQFVSKNGVHTNKTRWMSRFNNYILSFQRIRPEIYGYEALSIIRFRQKEWDNNTYD